MVIMINNQWCRVPYKLIRDKDMTVTDIAVFAVIADIVDGDSISVSTAEIMLQTGFCKRAVINAINRLSSKDYIQVQKIKGKASIYSQNLLPPKKRPSRKQNIEMSSDPEVEKYKVLVNKF